MAKKKAGFVVVKDAKGDIYVSELGDPVTDSMTKSDKGDLGKRFDDYKKAAGRSGSAEAVIIEDVKGAIRILQRGDGRKVNDDPSKKKKKGK
jgi:hypothetical protein